MTARLEGLLAINKPTGISSAEALRQLQRIFKPSTIFAATLADERERRESESHNQRSRRRRRTELEVKIGHGGTLDPMASGVLITGIGAGTKQLPTFLGGTKTYEATALFGVETDTYDALGKVTRWRSWEGIDRAMVEGALDAFRGDIMQKPPIYSALHMDGKRLYEYAREGKPLPVEIKPRPVSTVSMELVDFTFDHAYEFPAEEAPMEEMVVFDALEGQAAAAAKAPPFPFPFPSTSAAAAAATVGEKRASSEDASDEKAAKKQKGTTGPDDAAAADPKASQGKPFIVTLRMTVTSGFYVRSLIHDLGHALGSAAHMVKLVRTRQSQYELGNENVFEWEELMEKPEEHWGPKVEATLRKWAEDRID